MAESPYSVPRVADTNSIAAVLEHICLQPHSPAWASEQAKDAAPDDVSTKNLVDEKKDAKKVNYKDFFTETSMHGVPHLVGDASVVRKLLWLILVVVCTVVMVYQIKKNWDKFESKPVSTSIDLMYHSNLTFPAVVLCNMNSHSLTKAYHTEDAVAYYMLKEYNHPYGGFNATAYADYLDQYPGGPGKDNSRTFDQHLTLDFEHMLLFCDKQYGAASERYCIREFEPIYTDAGLCYGINMRPENADVVTSGGQTNSLTMLLDLQSYEHMFGSYTIGLKVIIADQGDVPTDSHAVAIAPGFDTTISLHRMESVRVAESSVGAGRGACREYRINETTGEQSPLTYYEDQPYTLERCVMDNQWRHIRHTCGCEAFNAPIQDETNICSLEQELTCVSENQESIKDGCAAHCRGVELAQTTSLSRMTANSMESILGASDVVSQLYESNSVAADARIRLQQDRYNKQLFQFLNGVLDVMDELEAKGMAPLTDNYVGGYDRFKMSHECFTDVADDIEEYLMPHFSLTDQSKKYTYPSDVAFFRALLDMDDRPYELLSTINNVRYHRHGEANEYFVDMSWSVYTIASAVQLFSKDSYDDDVVLPEHDMESYRRLRAVLIDFKQSDAHWPNRTQVPDPPVLLRELCETIFMIIGSFNNEAGAIMMDYGRVSATNNYWHYLVDEIADFDFDEQVLNDTVSKFLLDVHLSRQLFQPSSNAWACQAGLKAIGCPTGPSEGYYDPADCAGMKNASGAAVFNGVKEFDIRAAACHTWAQLVENNHDVGSNQEMRQIHLDNSLRVYNATRRMFECVREMRPTALQFQNDVGVHSRTLGEQLAALGSGTKHLWQLMQINDQFYSSSLALLNIHYGDLSVKQYKQELSYTIWNFASDIGGTLGLFLGASIMVVGELIDFFVIRRIFK